MSLGPAVHMALLDFTASYGVSHARKAKITGGRHGTDRKAMLTPPPLQKRGPRSSYTPCLFSRFNANHNGVK